MAHDPSEIPRSVPRWAIVAAAAGLIALIALTSRPAGTAAGGPDLAPHLALTVAEVVGYVALALGIVALITGLIFSRAQRRERSAPRRRTTDLEALPRWVQLLAMLVLGALLAGQIAVVISYLAEVLQLAARSRNGATGDGSWFDSVFGAGPAQDLTALTIALVIVLAIAISVVVFVAVGRIRDDRQPEGLPRAVRSPALEAVELSIDALRRAPDPRRAVVAAYAAMERSLSGAGLERRRSEAPFEYLQRVLAAPIGASDDLRTMTRLFQRARFSRHPVDESMRDEALGALERIRHAAGVAR